MAKSKKTVKKKPAAKTTKKKAVKKSVPSKKAKTKKNQGGRPPRYNKNYHPMLVEYMAKCGLTDKEMAVNIGIVESTFYKWKQDHKEFSESLKKGKEPSDDLVEAAFYQRCLGYEHDAIHISNYKGKVTKTKIVKKYPPDTAAIKFWLTNRRPEQWREKITNELVGKGEERLELVSLADILSGKVSNEDSDS